MNPTTSSLHTLPLRLLPGADLRSALERRCAELGLGAVFVLAGIGSLRPAQLRLAGVASPTRIDSDVELLTLSGTVSPSGAHLHMSVSDAAGRVLGGHVSPGCIVRTTAEILLAVLPEWAFSREADADTGFAELVVRRVPKP